MRRRSVPWPASVGRVPRPTKQGQTRPRPEPCSLHLSNVEMRLCAASGAKTSSDGLRRSRPAVFLAAVLFGVESLGNLLGDFRGTGFRDILAVRLDDFCL